MDDGQSHTITTTEELERVYSDAPYGPALFKETDRITPQYRKLIEAAPFVVVATSGPEGLDCSPRGDPPGFVRVVDEHTIIIPESKPTNMGPYEMENIILWELGYDVSGR